MNRSQEPMRILVIGAGVIGSLCAARLSDTGHQVTVLARGQRNADLNEHGIVLEDASTGQKTVSRVGVAGRLLPDDEFDLAIVTVRKNQVEGILPLLEANSRIQSVLFMVNNPLGPEQWVRVLGPGRLLLGFPGAGGTREGHVIRYSLVPPAIQLTTFGEIDGSITARLKRIHHAFVRAGIPSAISRNMDAWQKTHVAWVSPFANAIYMAGGDNYALARQPESVGMLVRAIREHFAVLKALGVPVTPAKMNLFKWMPAGILTAALRMYLKTRQCELVATRHANAAKDEMKQLADEFAELARHSGVATPEADRLRMYI